ncbi:VOC family protein [Streptomyces sp. DSM 40750]|uniref:VOC family protein n=1 Tax=Streptomyces sp. DSM 40750 TaxID=2801030 RepID=UPI00214BBA75|nr:VOC family protein [Streptomyces sp. DSM 40750]UUU19632.1 VOC family protein [Streptomyces sp. DSM 40750]UUU27026.1 VOC family protein [Streptomyces sp. DSM 40750]
MRVSGLLHYGLQLPDLARGKDFYTDFGLSSAERGNQLVVRCDGRDQDQTVLVEGPDKRLHHVAFAAPVGSLPELQRHLESLGTALQDAPAEGLQGGLWFRDPDGNAVNVREQELAPPRLVIRPKQNLAGDYQRVDEALWLTANTPPRPRRLGHMLLFSSDINRSQEFYERTLGLRLSDKIPGAAVFMNAGPGDHHVFGFVRSSHPGLHHSSWEVGNLDELMVGAQTMADRGHRIGWGLGRHFPGSNLFHYMRDPWGSWIEYFIDMDQITENWQAREWGWDDAKATPERPAVWCPVVPEAFMHNLEPKPE